MSTELADQLRQEFSRRDFPERYEKSEEAVTEKVTKVSPVEANYRSAFSAARCAGCGHFQEGSKTCELVKGEISPDAVCDFYAPKRENETEAANRLWNENVERYALPSETSDISPEKAKKMLEDGHANGKALSDAQRGMLGAIAGKGD